MRSARRQSRRHVIVFAKAPRLGTVKRRLAADIGALAAWRFYRETGNSVVRALVRDARWQTWVAVTPDTFVHRGRFWPEGAARLPQGDGDLGQRMGRALRRFAGEPAVIVGSDLPENRTTHIADAFAALGDSDAVLGPSGDGGYWLVGARDVRRLSNLFVGVRWSSRHALSDTLANLEGRRVALVERLDDVDDGEALARWRASSRRRFPAGGA